MVKKLFKHEIRALGRVLFPAYGIMLAIGLFTRLMTAVEFDHKIYDIAFGSTQFFFYAAAIACTLLTVAMTVVRFYRHLFSSEGYLSFTLPVTATQHLWVKLITATLFWVMSVFAVLLAGVLAIKFELLVEFVKVGLYWIEQVIESPVGWHFWVWLAELLVTLPLMLGATMLLYYTCMTVGQLAKKNRVLSAVGVYMLIYVATQVISTVGIGILSLTAELWSEPLVTFITNHPYPFVHLCFAALFIVEAIVCTVWFLVCRYILNRRLNLE